MSDKIVLTGLSPEEICSSLSLAPSFRGKQIYQWIFKGATDFEQMTNLQLTIRTVLPFNFAGIVGCAIEEDAA